MERKKVLESLSPRIQVIGNPVMPRLSSFGTFIFSFLCYLKIFRAQHKPDEDLCLFLPFHQKVSLTLFPPPSNNKSLPINYFYVTSVFTGFRSARGAGPGMGGFGVDGNCMLPKWSKGPPSTKEEIEEYKKFMKARYEAEAAYNAELLRKKKEEEEERANIQNPKEADWEI